MNRLEINLGRDFIMPSGIRHQICKVMQIYLAVCVPLLFAAAYVAFLNIREAEACRSGARMVRAGQGQSSGGRNALLHRANQLKNQVQKAQRQTQALRATLPPVTHTVMPILNFIINQSDSSTILNTLAMANEKNKPPALGFSLALPVGSGTGQNFLRDWQTNRELADYFSSITPVTTRLGNSDTEGLVIVNYRAVFKEKP